MIMWTLWEVGSKIGFKIMHPLAREKRKDWNMSKSQPKTRRCYNCGEKRHFINDCIKPRKHNDNDHGNLVTDSNLCDVFMVVDKEYVHVNYVMPHLFVIMIGFSILRARISAFIFKLCAFDWLLCFSFVLPSLICACYPRIWCWLQSVDLLDIFEIESDQVLSRIDLDPHLFLLWPTLQVLDWSSWTGAASPANICSFYCFCSLYLGIRNIVIPSPGHLNFK